MRRTRGPEDSISQRVQGKEDQSLHQCVQGKEDRRIPSVCAGKRGPEDSISVCRECSQEDPGSQSHGLLVQKQAGSRGTWGPDPGKASGPGIPCSSCLAPYLALTIFPALSSTISSNPTANMSAGLLSPGEQGKRAKKSELPDLVLLFHGVLFLLSARTCSLLDPPYLATHRGPATGACLHFPPVLIAHATSALPCIRPGAACEPL